MNTLKAIVDGKDPINMERLTALLHRQRLTVLSRVSEQFYFVKRFDTF